MNYTLEDILDMYPNSLIVRMLDGAESYPDNLAVVSYCVHRGKIYIGRVIRLNWDFEYIIIEQNDLTEKQETHIINQIIKHINNDFYLLGE